MLKSRRNLLSALVVGVLAGAVAMPTFAADKKITLGLARSVPKANGVPPTQSRSRKPPRQPVSI